MKIPIGPIIVNAVTSLVYLAIIWMVGRVFVLLHAIFRRLIFLSHLVLVICAIAVHKYVK